MNLTLTVQSPRPSGIPVPALQTISLAMKSQLTVGLYTLFAASYALPGTQVPTAKFNIVAGTSSDSIRNVHELSEITYPLSNPNATNTTIQVAKPAGRTVNGFTYQGCQTDSRGTRSLRDKTTWSVNMTIEACSSFCAGYQYFGTEYSKECYCGNELSTASIAVKEPDCWMQCSGDAKSNCGGTDRISLFKALKYTPVVTKPAVVANYEYRGCYEDAVSSRILKDGFFGDEDMTTTKCAGLCKGSTYFGTEYGGECYCGSRFPAAARQVSEKDCYLSCKGDKREICGAGNRLSVYWKIP